MRVGVGRETLRLTWREIVTLSVYQGGEKEEPGKLLDQLGC